MSKKALLVHVAKLKSALEEEVEARNLKLETASERWLESDKGEEYQDMTTTLEDFLSDLETFEESVDTEM